MNTHTRAWMLVRCGTNPVAVLMSLLTLPSLCVCRFVALSWSGIHTLDDALESGVLSTYSLGNVTQLLE